MKVHVEGPKSTLRQWRKSIKMTLCPPLTTPLLCDIFFVHGRIFHYNLPHIKETPRNAAYDGKICGKRGVPSFYATDYISVVGPIVLVLD